MNDLSNPPGGQYSILIVDDIEDNRVLLERNLRKAGYATQSCVNGMDAIAVVSSHMPDLVLLDWMMPGLSGLETLRAIREHADANKLPIIMCTALGEEESIVDALNAGANDYVMKPVSMPVLMARISSQLKRKDTLESLDAVNRDLEDTLVRRTRALMNFASK